MPQEPLTTPSVSSASEKISARQAGAYASGIVPLGVTDHALSFMANPIYNVMLGLSPVFVGNVQLASRIASVALDPLCAHASDSLRSRFGRRRPFLLGGGLLAAGCAWAFFAGPPGGTAHAAVYFLIVCLLHALALTLFGNAYNGLLPELSADSRERSRVLGLQLQVRALATFGVIWSLPFAQSTLFASVEQGLAVFGWIIGGISVLATLWLISSARERPELTAGHSDRMSLREAVLTCLRLRPLYPLFAAKLMLAVAGNLVNGLGFYILVYYAAEGSLTQGALWQSTTGTAWLVAVLLLTTPAVRLCNRLGRRTGYSLCCAVMIVASLLKPVCIRPGTGWEILLPALLMGPAWSVANLIMQAQAADLADYLEYETGRRQEAIALLPMSLVEKFLFPMASAASNYLLVGLGFVLAAGAHQAPGTFSRIMFWFTAIPVTFTAISWIVSFRYPLTEERMRQVRLTLAERRAAAGEPTPAA